MPVPPPAVWPKGSPQAALTIALVFGGLGLVGCGFGLWGYLRERAFLTRAIYVEATVISQTSTYVKGATFYVPEFTFTDGAGNLCFGTNREGKNTPYEIGQKVPVVYDPTNPDDAHTVDFWSDWGMAAFCGGFGAFLLLTGAAYIPIYFKARRDAATTAGR